MCEAVDSEMNRLFSKQSSSAFTQWRNATFFSVETVGCTLIELGLTSNDLWILQIPDCDNKWSQFFKCALIHSLFLSEKLLKVSLPLP